MSKRITIPPNSLWRSLMAFALIFALGLFIEAAAQWTTSGNDISNSNSGNVGVRTTAPEFPLQVNNASANILGLVYTGTLSTTSGAGIQSLTSGTPGAADQRLGFYTLGVRNGGTSYNPLAIQGFSSQGWSLNSAHGAFLTFSTTENGSTTRSERLRIDHNGNVGIGTTSPGERLVTLGNMLVGNITSHTQLYSTYDSQSNMIMELGYGTATADITPLPSFVISKNLSSANNALGVISFANSNIANGNDKRLSYISSWTDGALNSGALVFGTSLTGTLNERMRIIANGNVGIGTTTPSTRFEVVGASPWIAKFKKTDNSNGGIIIDSNPGYNPNVALGVNGTNKWYLLSNSSSSDVLQFWESSGSFPRFTLTQAGTVGIGTATPNAAYKLDVAGNVNTSGLCFAGDCKTAWSQVGGSSQWTTNGSAINYSSGNVGIGTASPVYSLDVNGGLNGFRAKASTVSATDTVAAFESSSGIQMIVRGNGNVGIGTTSPSNKLHVAGSITVDGNINAKYQDVAEWVESSQDLTPGTVVILDSSRSNQVIAATQSYDSRVAGVISLQPGIALGERGEGRVLVAAAGRVKVKVDASNGPVQIGDLLVTADKEGFAMKSVPVEIGGIRIHRPGTLIGKALEPLANGTGEILVLLSLQ